MTKEIKMRSSYEKRIYEASLREGHVIEYEPSKPVIRYTTPHRYTPDFKLPNGILVEAKGWLRPRDRGKMARVRKEYPDLDIRFLFQKADKRIASAPTSQTYGEWAEKYGFPWAEGDEIPEEWFNE